MVLFADGFGSVSNLLGVISINWNLSCAKMPRWSFFTTDTKTHQHSWSRITWIFPVVLFSRRTIKSKTKSYICHFIGITKKITGMDRTAKGALRPSFIIWHCKSVVWTLCEIAITLWPSASRLGDGSFCHKPPINPLCWFSCADLYCHIKNLQRGRGRLGGACYTSIILT